VAVPSGTFWIAIAEIITKTPIPASLEAKALPIAKPSGRLWANSTPTTSSERVRASPRPSCAAVQGAR